jgi:DNA primase
MHIYVVNWKEESRALPGDDVDSFIRREGPAAFEAMIARAKPHMDVVIDQATEAWEASDVYERSRTVKRLLEAVAGESDPVIRAHYRKRIAQLADITPADVERAITPRQQKHRSGAAFVPRNWGWVV